MPILTPEERLGGTVAGRYRFERILATGGMSVLFEGTDQRAHRKVAIKLLRPNDMLDPQRIDRFLQEMQTTARLRHPHVIDVLDMGRDDQGVPFLVIELLHGRSLGQELSERGVLPPDETLELLLPIMGALATTHDAGVVHRDLKPDNIFLCRGPRGERTSKLLDFGIAKVLEADLQTRTGAVLGTPEYMAPEQARAEVVRPATDVWAIGAVLYRCLSGRAPFTGASSAEIVSKLLNEAPPPLAPEGVDRAFCASVERALSRNPESRYADMREFARALIRSAHAAGIRVEALPEPVGLPDTERWLNEPAPDTLAATASLHGAARKRSRRRVMLSALLASALAVLVALGLLALRRSTSSSPPVDPAPRAQTAAPAAPVRVQPKEAPPAVPARAAPAEQEVAPSAAAPRERVAKPRALRERPTPRRRPDARARPEAASAPSTALPVATEW